MSRFLQPTVLRLTKDNCDVELQVRHIHLFTIFDWEFAITRILGKYKRMSGDVGRVADQKGISCEGNADRLQF